jgi:hypothetical protein
MSEKCLYNLATEPDKAERPDMSGPRPDMSDQSL